MNEDQNIINDVGQPVRSSIFFIILSTILSHIFTITVPIFVLTVYDKVIPYASFHTLFALTTGVVIFLIFDLLTKCLRARMITWSASEIDGVISSKIKSRLDDYYSPHKQLNLIRGFPLITQSVNRYRDIWSGSNLLTIIDAPFSLIYLTIIYLVSPTLFLVILSFSVIHYIVCLVLTKLSSSNTIQETSFQEQRNYDVNKLGSLWERLHVSTERAISTSMWLSVEQMVRKSKSSRGRWDNYIAIWAGSFPLYSTVGVTFIGALLIVEGNLSIGGLIAVNMIAARVYGPAVGLSKIIQLLPRYRNSVKTLQSLFQKNKFESSIGSEPLGNLREVSFRNVNVEGQDQHHKLTNISVNLSAGNIYAICGESGSGLDEFIDILLQNKTVSHGIVFINDIPIGQISYEELFSTIDLVTNYPIVVGGSARDHLGDLDDIDPEIVSRAMRASGLLSFLDLLPDGIDSKIANINLRLRRDLFLRLSLCRALISPKKIIVLDLDPIGINPFSFDNLMKLIVSIKSGRIIIFRTNREDVTSYCDEILMFSNGEMSGKGSYRELMKSKSNRNLEG